MNTNTASPTKPTYKAFHPQTMGVMYPCELITVSPKAGTVTVIFPTVTGTRHYCIPQNHVSVNGELWETPKGPKPVSNLVFFIESHCGCVVESYDGPGAKTIKVSSEIRQPDGTIQRQTETIPATIKVVKNWLGY